MVLPQRPRRSTALVSLTGLAALAVTGIALTTGPATAAPSPKASPTALAAHSAAGLVASRPASLHASKDDAYVAHAVISTREGLQYVPYDRTYKGLPVYGGDFVVVTDSTGKVLSTSAAQDKVVNVATTAAQTGAQAAAAARAQAKGKTVDSVSAARKVVLALGTPRLAYETVVASHAGATPSKLHVFTDANTGAVAYSYDEVREGTGTGKWNGPNPLTIATSHPTSTTWTMTDPIRSGINCRNSRCRAGDRGCRSAGAAVEGGSDAVGGAGGGRGGGGGGGGGLGPGTQAWRVGRSWRGRTASRGRGGGSPSGGASPQSSRGR